MASIIAPHRRNIRVVLPVVAALVVGALVLGQIVGGMGPGDASADAGFIRDMTAHHQQAIEMAEIVRFRTTDPRIRLMATEIALTQQSEIGRMGGWLDLWGLTPAGGGERMKWMGHEGLTTYTMPGMSPPEEVRRLGELPEEQMNVAFLRMMIYHHQGAIPMAQAAVEMADSTQVRALARGIISAQTAEIRLAQDLLARRGLSPDPSAAASAPSNASNEQRTAQGQLNGGAAKRAGDEPAMGGHHSGGFVASMRPVLRDMVRLAPLAIAIFVAAWLALDRRRASVLGIAVPNVRARGWQWLAVVGLGLSALVHIGMTPMHFEEAPWQGVLFFLAGVAAAALAAALLRPSRPAAIAGAALALGLMLAWAIFRVVPPPGAASTEGVDLIGLLTKAAELAALVGCVALLRGAPIQRGHADGADASTAVAGV